MSGRPGPALTWYGTDRVELTGPVIARWMSKIANLLTGDLTPDPFGTPTGGTLTLRLPRSWQGPLWASTALLTNWKANIESLPTNPDSVLLTHRVDEESTAHAQAGGWVLVQDLSPMSVRFPQPLPPGMTDALVEVMAQPDALTTAPPTGAPSVEDLVTAAPTGHTSTTRILALSRDPKADALTLLSHWSQGRSVVLVDPQEHDEDAIQSIAGVEGARPAAP
nr:TIGR03089 family protein [Schaalia sp. 19OD2882]